MASGSAVKATSVLRDEHQLILKVARELARLLAADRAGTPLELGTVARCVTFFGLFADACHHGKEEDLLFPELEAEGMPHDSGPIAVMLSEHERGRALVRQMSAALPGARGGDGPAGAELRDAAGQYITLIEDHIDKEDNMFFNLADGMIVGAGCRALCRRYDVVEGRRFDGRTKQDLEELAETILSPGPAAGLDPS